VYRCTCVVKIETYMRAAAAARTSMQQEQELGRVQERT
jgi:hypothetical protein